MVEAWICSGAALLQMAQWILYLWRVQWNIKIITAFWSDQCGFFFLTIFFPSVSQDKHKLIWSLNMTQEINSLAYCIGVHPAWHLKLGLTSR